MGVTSEALSLGLLGLSILVMFNWRPRGVVIVGGCSVRKLPEIHVEKRRMGTTFPE
jgi:hypothetical protein